MVKSTKFASYGIVLVVFIQKKTGPNRPSNGKFMAVLPESSRFHALHKGGQENFVGMGQKTPVE